ncbi:MAG: phosphoglycerate kinase [Bacteroidales bacterium]|nr:phosphoglycerate kinase [Bacteroidales bacterium]
MSEKINVAKLQDADLNGKVVLVRVDHNVVKKGGIKDPYRIDSTIGTLIKIYSKGGRPILMSHVGRPKDKKSGEITLSKDTSVQPVVEYLENKLQLNIRIPELKEESGKGITDIDASVQDQIRDLKEGQVDALYLPNTRWFYGEEDKGEASEKMAGQLAELADVFVNDAFGSWQPHTSTVGVNKHLPSYAGLLMQKEIENLQRIFNPEKPFISVVAGAKFDTKADSLYALLERSDYLALGGVIYNAYLCAKYDIRIEGVSDDDIKVAREFIDYSKKKNYEDKILELPYIIESDTMEGKVEGQYREHDVRGLKAGTKLNYVLDVSAKSFQEQKVQDAFSKARTIFTNAVMGLTPHFDEGTIALDKLIDSNKGAMKLFGGGDTNQELKTLLPGVYMKAVDDPGYYLFTGGGAVLKAIQEGTTEGIEPVKALIK